MHEQVSMREDPYAIEYYLDDISALDEMFARSSRYRSSKDYFSLLLFISRFPKYAPFNCMLLHIQNPGISFVATARKWMKEFKRQPKRDARPLVILAPGSPVAFVYDLMDTEGEPVPPHLLRPFETQGTISSKVFDTTVHNAERHGILVRETRLRHFHGGRAIKLAEGSREKYQDFGLTPEAGFLILLNEEECMEDKYGVLAHELGHIFIGHCGTGQNSWWPDRSHCDRDMKEIEAESVAFLVCRRKGLTMNSEKYLAGYGEAEKYLPSISMEAVIKATTFIEKMGKAKWKAPRKKVSSK